MAGICSSWRETSALRDVATGGVEVLQDSDWPVLHEDVGVSSLHETQRWFVLVVMFRTGLRPESLGRLLVDSVVIRGENGVRYLAFGLGTINTLQGSLAKVDAALIKQRVNACPDAAAAVQICR